MSHEAAQPSRGSPSIPPPNSMLEVSTSSASTSSGDEEVVQQPVQAPMPKVNWYSSVCSKVKMQSCMLS